MTTGDCFKKHVNLQQPNVKNIQLYRTPQFTAQFKKKKVLAQLNFTSMGSNFWGVVFRGVVFWEAWASRLDAFGEKCKVWCLTKEHQQEWDERCTRRWWDPRRRVRSAEEKQQAELLRFSLVVARMDRIRNEDVRGTAHVRCFGEKVREVGLRLSGHVQRRDSGYIEEDQRDLWMQWKRTELDGGRWFVVGTAEGNSWKEKKKGVWSFEGQLAMLNS